MASKAKKPKAKKLGRKSSRSKAKSSLTLALGTGALTTAQMQSLLPNQMGPVLLAMVLAVTQMTNLKVARQTQLTNLKMARKLLNNGKQTQPSMATALKSTRRSINDANASAAARVTNTGS